MILFARSYYSLKFGVLSPKRIVEIAKQYSFSSIILTDINNTSGFFELYKEAQSEGLKVFPGCEIRVNNMWLYTYVSKNTNGLKQIHDFLTFYQLNRIDFPSSPKYLSDCFTFFPFSINKQGASDTAFLIHSIKNANKIISQTNSKVLCFYPLLTFESKEEFELHCNLRAISENSLLSKLDSNNLADGSENIHEIVKVTKSIDSNQIFFKNYLGLESQLSYSIELKSNKNKIIFSNSREEDKSLLYKLCYNGLKERYGDNELAKTRLEYELSVIEKLDFVAYFLIAWDIISYSMSKGYYHIGRGSGANSIAAYCLRITDVDPIELDLYFERFLNPKRTSPPDFDIDFSWKERDDVLEYIFRKHGPQNTALLGTFSTFKDSSIIRELGKVYGLPKNEIDDLVNGRLRNVSGNNIADKIVEIGKKIENFPSHRSIHAGGVLISQEEISNYSALDMPPKGFPTVQWDMYVSADIGFEKFDILSQRGIGHIKDAVELVKLNKGIDVDIHQVNNFKTDNLVQQNLYNGNTIGCFYIESPAMRGLLKKLKCKDYKTLVAASSIIRPGVAKSGMMKQYIINFNNPDKIKYLHPVLEVQLKETFGIMVYQEDVLKVCHHFGGLDLADADVLRRIMSGKQRTKREFERIHAKFFQNCETKGFDKKITEEVWRQIESFAGYSFSKAHSASYAVESFQSLFLKTYYPLEFMVAVINNFGGFYSTWVYVNEAKKLGGIIELPCIFNSEVHTNIKGNIIHLGFAHISTLETSIIEKIISERAIKSFLSVEDFVRRVKIGKEQLIILIRSGAFRKFNLSKKELLWKSIDAFENLKIKKGETELFTSPSKQISLPPLEHTIIEDAFDEMELIGFFVSVSAFDMLKTKYRAEISVKNLIDNVGKKIKLLGHLVTVKMLKTSKGDSMCFGTFLDQNGDFFDTVHFSSSLKNYPFTGKGIYLLYGKVVEEFGFPTIEIEKMAKLPYQADPRYL